MMSKFDGRRKASLKQLNESLQRLEVDHLDLWQFHENIRLGTQIVSSLKGAPAEI